MRFQGESFPAFANQANRVRRTLLGMVLGMLWLALNFQVSRIVVGFVLILVVNVLKTFKEPADFYFHQNPVKWI